MSHASSTHTPLYTVAQIRALEQSTIHQNHLNNGELMERAGSTAFRVLKETWPAARQIVVVTGAGNNGGDGYVLARLAHLEKLSVHILTIENPQRLKGDAERAYQQALEAGVSMGEWNTENLLHADVIVDALLGTGIKHQLDDTYKNIIQAINAANIPILAIDIPSGLCANSGRIYGAAIHATATITFIGLKCGLFTGCAADYIGEIFFNDLGVPESAHEKIQPEAYCLDSKPLLSPLTTQRSRTAHKGDFGHVLVIGGDYGYAGAVHMSAIAALRTGAGLVSVATRPEHVGSLVALHPEIMAHGIVDAEALDPLIERATVIILGPGLGRTAWSQSLWLKAVATHMPLIMDADGLYWLSEDPHISREWILTPHPKEAARLLKTQVERIQIDRFHAALNIQHQYGGVAVLKGAGTIIQPEESKPYVCALGNPGMATGGMGDVLSGVIGGLAAQHFSLEDAAKTGVYIHSRAADLAAREGERGMLATDLLPYIRQLMNPSS